MASQGIRGRARRRLLGLAQRVSRMAKAMAVGGVVVSGILFVFYPSGTEMSLPVAMTALLGLGAMFASPFVGLVGMALRWGGFRRPSVLHRTDGRVFLTRAAGGPNRALGRVVSGVILPSRDGFDVQLRLADGTELSVHVNDEATADALLDLAGVGPDQRTTRVRWAHLSRRLGVGTLAFLATLVLGFWLMLSVPSPWDVPALYLALVAPFVTTGAASQWLAWRELAIGTDGVAWTYRGRKKVVPVRDVRRVEVRGDDLIVGLADGTDRRFTIPVRGLAEGLRRRLEAVLAAGGHGKQSLFARGERTFADWVARMQGILRGGGAHRERPVEIDDAMAVLEDPHAEPETRVGAAIALAAEPAAAARVRVVAETCVSPKLRVALETAADGELVEALLEEVRDELRLAGREGAR